MVVSEGRFLFWERQQDTHTRFSFLTDQRMLGGYSLAQRNDNANAYRKSGKICNLYGILLPLKDIKDLWKRRNKEHLPNSAISF